MGETNPTPGTPVTASTTTNKGANGHTLLCVIDPQGYTITLDMHTWDDHIAKRHPEMQGYRDLISAVAEKPQLIQKSESGTGMYYYYRLTGRPFHKSTDIYLSLIVDRNEVTKSGTIRTAHLVRQVRSEGETIWMSS